MIVVRATLLAGWLALIASMFWDPVTPHLTDPAATWSVFHVHGNGPEIQGHATVQRTYSMSARIWWTMLVPLIPLFLMVFGHEAWRRVCPLAFASQIPRHLKKVRKISFVERSSGTVASRVAIIGQGSWLDKNAWYLQIGFLFIGLCVRLLFINGNPHALAFFLLLLISASIVTGALWGGRTWCHYFCPVNIVQKIYTEPRGLLESSPHIHFASLGQSSCRVSGTGADKLACVGCTSSCSDIDLERSYWETLLYPARRNVYYIFYGLIWGFYGYYYLYAGAWDYYFSGYWSHESDQISHLLDSGLFIAHYAVPIPKLIAVPLVLMSCGAISLGAGKALESLYRYVRDRSRRIPEAEVVNHCLSFTAFLSINTFYAFGGRPNVLLLPPYVVHIIDLLTVMLSSMWLFTAIHRTPFKYRHESLAASLLGQLKKLKVDVSRYIEGRTIDDLKPDELYVLSKVLPAYTREQKVQAYKRVLDDVICGQQTTSAASLQMLQDLRHEMEIGMAEHVRLVDELGHDHAMELDPAVVSARERAQCVTNYENLIGRAVCKRIEEGDVLCQILDEPDFGGLISTLRASLQIDDTEHDAALKRLCGPGGQLEMQIAALLDQLKMLSCVKLAMTSPQITERLSCRLTSLLRTVVSELVSSRCRVMLSLLRAVGATDVAVLAASTCAALVTAQFVDVLMELEKAQADKMWKDVLDDALIDAITAALRGEFVPTDEQAFIDVASMRSVPSAVAKLPQYLRSLATDCEPLHCAIVGFALTRLDFEEAATWGNALLANHNELTRHWLVAEVIEASANGTPEAADLSRSCTAITITVGGQRRDVDEDSRYHAPASGNNESHHTFNGLLIRVGSNPENDLYLPESGVAPEHFVVRVRNNQAIGSLLGEEKGWMNGKSIEGEVVIRSGDILTLTPNAPPGVSLTFSVPDYNSPFTELMVGTVSKLAVLLASQSRPNTARAENGLEAAAEMARCATMRRYPADAIITAGDIPPGHSCAVAAGSLRSIRNLQYSDVSSAVVDDQSADLNGDHLWLSEVDMSEPSRLFFSGSGDDTDFSQSYRVTSNSVDLLIWLERNQ